MQTQFLMSVNNPILKNHKVYGQEILPGLAYIDMLFQLFRDNGFDYKKLELRNLTIYNPLTVSKDYEVLLTIHHNEIKKGKWSIKVEGIEQIKGKNISTTKRYITAEMHVVKTVVFDEKLDINIIKNYKDKTIELEEIYKVSREQDLIHTGFIKAEGNIYDTETARIIDISIGREALLSCEEFMFHPTIIDGCCVCSMAVFDSITDGEERLYIPLFYESFRASNMFHKECYTRVKHSTVKGKRDLLHMTVEFFDKQGRKIAEMKNFGIKLVREQGLINPKRKNISKVEAKSNNNKVEESSNKNKKITNGQMSEKAEDFLRQLLANRLQIPTNQVDIEVGYYEMGLDSPGLLELVIAIEDKIGTTLSPTLLFEYTTISALSEYLSEEYREIFNQDSFIEEEIAQEENTFEEDYQSTFVESDEDIIKSFEIEEDIAVIGMANRYPQATNPEEFWQNLCQGKDLITEIPKSRWDWHIHEETKSPSGKSMSKWGGFIENPDCFDPQFFRISPREAEHIDPQERLFLQACWEAIEDAGYTPNTLVTSKGQNKRRHVGVFAGIMHKDYTLIQAEEVAKGQAFVLSLNCAQIANRVSYFCNFHGPSMAVDTVCSSSLTATHLAIESLKRGECEVALAGAVNLSLHPIKYLSVGMIDMHSSDGYCHTFGKGGDGYVSGEGIGVVLLKPLRKAIRDKDNIYAVIKGSSINHVGAVSGITVPSPVAQAEMIIDCFNKTNINPRTISYMEAHGTGTILGDPIEIQGLNKAYSQFTKDKQFCSIGSVKSNVGHAESAAGISGLQKTILQLHHKTLVPTLHSQELNPYLNLEESPFYIQHETSEWKQPTIIENGQEVTYPRRAGISSFGATGSNGHIILEEYISDENMVDNESNNDDSMVIIPLSAKNEDRLREYAKKILSFLDYKSYIDSLQDTELYKISQLKDKKEEIVKYKTKEVKLSELSYTLQVGREPMEERISFIVKNISELKVKLEKYLNNEASIDSFWSGNIKRDKKTVELLGSDKDSIELIEKWINKRNLKKIAELWSKGCVIDWKSFYRKNIPRRISLPTYPFAMEKYWVPKLEEDISSNKFNKNNHAVIHQLIHHNTSDFYEQKYTSTFTGKEFFLSDHIVKGQKMLPGAAYLEMARMAIISAIGEESIRLNNVVWIRPIIVGQNPISVNISLYINNDEEIGFEVYANNEHGLDRIVYCQGSAIVAKEKEESKLDIAKLKTECSGVILSATQCYELFRTVGLEYGLAHKGIEKLYLESSQALAKLSIPDTIIETLEDYVLHPSLIDSALQTTIGLGMDLDYTKTFSSNSKTKESLPFELQELEILGKCTKDIWVYSCYSEGTKESDSVKRYNIYISDINGNVCVRMKGFSTREISNKVQVQEFHVKKEHETVEKVFGDILMTPMWDVTTNTESKTSPNTLENIVIVGGTENHKKEIEKLYKKVHAVDINKNHNIDEIAEKLKACGDIDHIMWISNYSKINTVADSLLIEEQKLGVIHLLRLIKAVLSIGYGDKPLGWSIITTQSQPVFKDDCVNPSHASVHGFVGSMAKESPRWKIRLVDIQNDNKLPIQEICNLSYDRKGRGWVWRNENWYTQQLIPLDAPVADKSMYKTKGVYVVIGGAGDIGQVWSEYMIKTYKAQIIWIGRRSINKQIQDKIDKLSKLGVSPEYIQADATSLESFEKTYKQIKQKYKQINGIVHAALVLKDQILKEVEEEKFNAVLSSKVNISVNMAKVLKEEKLDFILFFSSIIAFIKNTGQSNYAAGCTFKDAFAHQLAKELNTKVKVMNWGFWYKDENESPETYQIYLKLTQIGMGAIQAPEAMEALEKLLIGNINQMALMKTLKPLDVEGLNQKEIIKVDNEGNIHRHNRQADKALADRKIGTTPIDINNKEQNTNNISSNSGQISENLLREKTTNYLKEIVSKILKMSSSKIDSSEALEVYGIDSIVIIQLTNSLKKELDNITSTIFFECQTIDQLTEHFIETQRTTLIHLLGLDNKNEIKEALKVVEQDTTTNYNQINQQLSVGLEKPKINRFSNSKALVSREGIVRDIVKDIAIVGVSGRYANADNVNEYWNNLKQGKNCITVVPKERWDWKEYFHEEKGRKGSTYTRYAGFINGIDKFDPLFFQISPKEATNMDPQERLFIETVYESIEDAGYTPTNLCDSRKIGVFAGVMYGHYPTGAKYWSIANRLSYLFNFQGPSMSLDTACSSSLTAIHLAIESINNGICECAIAGGVNLIVSPEHFIGLSEMTMLSTGDKCKAFGNKADGFVDGEGVGAVVLKPLQKAIDDGDNIYGVIKGSMINTAGKTNGYTVPNPLVQAELIEEALKRAKVNPRAVSYIEAHGTGTSLGDPIEISGLTRAFEKSTKDKQFCAIGSAKSNIGHCESAAGIAAITKVLMQFKHGQIAPSLHSSVPNLNISFESTPFVVQQELTEWKRPLINIKGETKEFPRIAGISSFGAGGSNAHIVIEEYVNNTNKTVSSGLVAIVLSAKDEEKLYKKAEDLLKAVEQEKYTNNDLENIAFTLQVGREAMEERLVVIVSSIKELEEKLNSFLMGEINDSHIFRGQVKRNKETLNVLLTDEDMKNTIRMWIEKGKISKISELWAKGMSFDWKELYEGKKHQRVSLPKYPFAKERYWLEEENKKVVSSNTSKEFIHPLLNSNTSTLLQQSYRTILTGNEFYLTDHIVNGRKILPGVAYLEMVHASIISALEVEIDSSIRIKNVVWIKPLEVTNLSKEVCIKLDVVEDNEIRYEIFGKEEGRTSDLTIYCQGSAELMNNSDAPVMDLGKFKDRCTQGNLYPNQIYDTFKTIGIEYGSSHMGIQEIYMGAGEVLAKLKLPNTLLADFDQYTMHPTMMDSALQGTIGLMIASGSITPALPYSMQELIVYRKCSLNMWALIRYSEGSTESDKIKRHDIDLVDEDGKLCISIKGFSVRTGEEGKSVYDKGIFYPQWQEQQAIDTDSEIGYKEHIIMLCELDASIKNIVKEQIKHTKCYDLKTENNSIDKRYEDYSVQVFKEIQNILSSKPEDKVLLQILVPNIVEKQVFIGLSSLLKTAMLENPSFVGQIILLDLDYSNTNLACRLEENKYNPNNCIIKYENNKRYIIKWSELIDNSNILEIPWKDEGKYLITGGTGSLAQIFAKDIASKTNEGTLILVGRSNINKDIESKINEIKKLVVDVDYIKADVSNKEDVKKLFYIIREKYGSLSGIIHTAGMTRDDFIIKKSQESFRQVLTPKTTGLVNLDIESKDMNLDLFILCSSVAGAVGNIGQADYSTANGFMDAYALYRNTLVKQEQRKGKTQSINWSLWKDGGIKVDEETAKAMLKTMGTVPMSTDIGLKAMYSSIVKADSQVMIIEGLKDRFLQAISEKADSKISTLENNSVLNKKDNTILNTNKADLDNAIKEKSIIYFKNQLSEIIDLTANKIDSDASMEIYGIDSIMVMKLTNKLEGEFGSLPKTLFFEYQTIRELSEYFVKAYKDKLLRILDIEDCERPKKERLESSTISLASNIKPIINKKTNFNNKRIYDNKINTNKMEIAVIGVSGRYPGAKNINEYWKNLKDGKDCIVEIPKDRWDYNLYYDKDKNKVGKVYSKWGGFIDDVDKFDARFFNISPREAETIDPQERLFLETVYEAIEDSGYTKQNLDTKTDHTLQGNVGVYVGVMYEEYQLYGIEESLKGRPIALSGSAASIANRVSYYCNFHGPSISVDTMCSSSLTSIHLAYQSLRNGECELAIAGGVNVSIHPNKYLLLSQGNFASSKGRCESFGQGGDGYVPGEGAGAVILKPLHKAIEDNDNIYGVIKGTAINHGGKTNGYTVPNPKAQANVVAKALKESDVNPRTISYVEAHGTGTSLGDPIEISGLTKTFHEYTKDNQFCAIGSVKSNIGHCEGAAGIAGITKILLQMKYGQIVPSLHSKVLNPNIDFNNTPFKVQQRLTEWKRPMVTLNGETKEHPRIAGISAFGAGGSNAHIIFEEYIDNNKQPEIIVSKDNPIIIMLSAKNEKKLMEQANRLLQSINDFQYKDKDIVNIAYTLQVGREAMDERLAFTVSTIRELSYNLQAFIEGRKDIADIYIGKVKPNKEALSVFAYDEELMEVVEKWIEKKKYSKLLELWVKGLTIDWNKLYGEAKPRRISLYTYPFAKERYWATDNRKIQTSTISNSEDIKLVNIKNETQVSPVTENQKAVNISSEIKDIKSIEQGKILLQQLDEVVVNEEEFKKNKNIEQVNLQPLSELSETKEITLEDSIGQNNNRVGHEDLIEFLKESLAQAIYINSEDMDIDEKFIDMGLDSITGVEWIQAINNRYGSSITATKVYDYPTIREFAEYMISEINNNQLESYDFDDLLEKVQSGELDIESADLLLHQLVEDTGESSQEIEYNENPIQIIQEDNEMQGNIDEELILKLSMDLLQDELSKSLAEALYMNIEDIDVNEKFVDMGLDSITGVEWIQTINKKYGTSVTATKVYDYPTISEFAEYLVRLI